MTVTEHMERFTSELEAIQRVFGEELTPIVEVATHEFHVFWFELLPWYRRLWHNIVGHRHRESWLGLPAPSSEKDGAA